MGGLAPGWRLIKVPTLAYRASFTRSPISAIVAAALRALALTSCGFYGRECSVGEKTRPPFRPSERKQDLRLLRPDFGISGVGLHWFDVRNNHEAACRGRWGAASTSRGTSGSGRSCCGSAIGLSRVGILVHPFSTITHSLREGPIELWFFLLGDI